MPGLSSACCFNIVAILELAYVLFGSARRDGDRGGGLRVRGNHNNDNNNNNNDNNNNNVNNSDDSDNSDNSDNLIVVVTNKYYHVHRDPLSGAPSS